MSSGYSYDDGSGKHFQCGARTAATVAMERRADGCGARRGGDEPDGPLAEVSGPSGAAASTSADTDADIETEMASRL